MTFYVIYVVYVQLECSRGVAVCQTDEKIRENYKFYSTQALET